MRSRKKIAKDFSLPKLFNRYGYPFYLNCFVCNYLINNHIKIGQYKNVVSYRDEKSNLNAFIMFFKLVYWYGCCWICGRVLPKTK